MINTQSLLPEKLQNHFQSDNEVRKNAIKMLAEIGMPGQKSEAYKYTSITSLLEKKADFESSNSRAFDPKDFYNTSGNHIVVINGVFSKEDSVIESGLRVESGDPTEGKHDPLSLLNTAFSSEEICISAAGSVSSIFIYYLNTTGFSNPRVKVNVSVSQELTIVEKPLNDSGVFNNSYIEFELAANSKVNLTRIQDYGSDVHSHETIFVKQSGDSRFYSNVFSFSGAMIRNNITINLDGENCEGHMHGLYLLDEKSHVDNNTSVNHIKPNSYSNEVYKGILDEHSTGVFNGKIYVRPHAQKTNAFQSNNNILLSDDATVNTKPQLEIWADDVKCSHGCTTGQMDEDAIFYLRARGIDERNAKAMLLRAFAEETFRHVSVEEVKQEVESLIDNGLK